MAKTRVLIRRTRRSDLSGEVKITLYIGCETPAEFTVASDIAVEMEDHAADLSESVEALAKANLVLDLYDKN